MYTTGKDSNIDTGAVGYDNRPGVVEPRLTGCSTRGSGELDVGDGGQLGLFNLPTPVCPVTGLDLRTCKECGRIYHADPDCGFKICYVCLQVHVQCSPVYSFSAPGIIPRSIKTSAVVVPFRYGQRKRAKNVYYDKKRASELSKKEALSGADEEPEDKTVRACPTDET